MQKYSTDAERKAAKKASWNRWAKKNRLKIKNNHAKTYKANKDAIKKSATSYAIKHPEINRRAQRKRKYGLSHEDFLNLLEAQKFMCAIGGEVISEETCHVDHNHDTGKVRGLLCLKHNIGLGHFNDNIDELKKAILYLRRR